MQSKTDASQSEFSLEALFTEATKETANLSQVKSAAAFAMKFLMLGDEPSYVDKIYQLAELSAHLLKLEFSLESVLQEVQSGITESHPHALELITSKIGLGQYQLAHATPHLFVNQNLEKQVRTMRHYKEYPLAELIEAIITDVLVQASVQFGAQIDNFDFLNCKPGLNQ
ncbi:hypothetical protein OQJ18_08820 [Fluoribacter dumoffii]|uniref:Uncharacterized protein n=1 Tax=Fluoribacter dumoffii TaxID=463 RepID=A0A377G7C1_9GAMM|nr:hypothetical protein [Fluoribacter dumoffii]KTC89543.1 hypothetical protein Ldum_0611 [Fluoribacter dumoffii NY 23]MCW8384737.1 hypothetical protein [Fluoribacter dumoffii]MCW8417800.1 hypothetical protein [Fluoribacter dumoffii]MCW8454358.1 hypothetical protein [Fluoribacter dumoffii]MCW8461568.1 hypothetical protein [Fluoribacter dumoffii]